jgi:exonuclease VII large subunit
VTSGWISENPDLLRAWSEKRAYRVAGIGHSGNSTALDLLSDFATTTPATAGTHIADALRTCRDSQQHVAELRAQNDELRMQLRQVQMHHAAQPLTPPPAPPQKEVFITTSAERTNSAQVMLALLIGMLTGVILLPPFLHQR